MYLTRLADICRAAGLDVVEVRGWKTRGHGPLSSVKTIVCHHTAGPRTGNMPSLNVVTNGRPGLKGPLCNLGLARDGTVYVVAAGLAYHAGQVRNSSYGNAYSIGIEAEATGVSSWPEVQMAAYAKLCAALVDAYGLTTSRVLGHKEVCYPVGRKSDPNFSMASFRSRVQKVLDAPTSIPATTAKQIFDAVWLRDRVHADWMPAANPTQAPQTLFVNDYGNGLKALDAVRAASSAALVARTDAQTVTSAAARTTAAAGTAATAATAAGADAVTDKASVARLGSAVDAVSAALTTSVAAAARAAVDASRITVHVDVRQVQPGTTAAPATVTQTVVPRPAAPG